MEIRISQSAGFEPARGDAKGFQVQVKGFKSPSLGQECAGLSYCILFILLYGSYTEFMMPF